MTNTNMHDLHPLAGSSREPGWTIKDETDALIAAEDKIAAITAKIVKEKGLDKAIDWLLTL